MAKKKINVYVCECERCKHKWVSRNEKLPVVCPKCKSPYWDNPKKKKL